MSSIFEYTLKDFYYAKAVVLLYLYESDDTDKDKIKTINKYLTHFDTDKAFHLFRKCLHKNEKLPSSDTMIDQDLTDMAYEDFVEEIQNVPSKSDVDIYIDQMVEIDKIRDWKSAYNILRKNPEASLRDVRVFLNKWGTDMNIFQRPEIDNSHEAVVTRMQDSHGDIFTGIREIDEITHGLRKGHLMAIGGYAGHGKTTTLLSMAYHNVTEHNKNCIVDTFEVTTDELRVWLMSRHSKNLKFRGIGRPVDRIRIQDPKLPQKDKDFIVNVVAPDLFDNPKYGNLSIRSHHEIPSLEISEYKNSLYETDPKVDIVFFDHLHATKNYVINGIKDEFRQMNYLVDAFDKQIAQDFFGETLLFVIGAQINRDRFLDAKRNYDKGLPLYDNNCWSGVNAIERSAYYAMSVYSSEALFEQEEILVQLLKQRGGKQLHTPITTQIVPEFLEVGSGIVIDTTPEYDELLGGFFDADLLLADKMDIEW